MEQCGETNERCSWRCYADGALRKVAAEVESVEEALRGSTAADFQPSHYDGISGDAQDYQHIKGGTLAWTTQANGDAACEQKRREDRYEPDALSKRESEEEDSCGEGFTRMQSFLCGRDGSSDVVVVDQDSRHRAEWSAANSSTATNPSRTRPQATMRSLLVFECLLPSFTLRDKETHSANTTGAEASPNTSRTYPQRLLLAPAPRHHYSLPLIISCTGCAPDITLIPVAIDIPIIVTASPSTALGKDSSNCTPPSLIVHLLAAAATSTRDYVPTVPWHKSLLRHATPAAELHTRIWARDVAWHRWSGEETTSILHRMHHTASQREV
ncbi:hypothetical protein C8J57DRAFT_1239605 [Mycena rebaudengoi]|nr:hypothetical protein C8J57DRAFT_1239605 [Mycena rebaudengoi]